MKALSMANAASGWSLGTIWPASSTLKNENPLDVCNSPAFLPLTFQSTGFVVLNSPWCGHGNFCAHAWLPNQLQIKLQTEQKSKYIQSQLGKCFDQNKRTKTKWIQIVLTLRVIEKQKRTNTATEQIILTLGHLHKSKPWFPHSIDRGSFVGTTSSNPHPIQNQ